MLFNPQQLRTNGFSAGMIAFYREGMWQGPPFGNTGADGLHWVLSAWLLGLQSEFSETLPRAVQWITDAIASVEEFGADQNTYLSLLHGARAIAKWMLDGVERQGDWDSARHFELLRWTNKYRPWSQSEIISFGLDEYMALACQCLQSPEALEHAIGLYEDWTGKRQPLPLSKLVLPRDFGYSICMHYTGRHVQVESDLFDAGRRLLRRYLADHWLGGGQTIRAVMWLKIVYSLQNTKLTPMEIILKAYDDMPKVHRPDFV